MAAESMCKKCRFWEERTVETPAMGRCRRHAPRAAAVSPLNSAENLDGVWPRTRPEDWCGEWEAGGDA